MRSLLIGLLAALLLLAPHRAAAEGTTSDGPTLRLVHLHDGLRPAAPDDDLARLAETKQYETAKKRGVDLAKPEHPLVAARYADGRLYYLFYKVVEDAFGAAYLVQRIKKTERTWAKAGEKPEEKVTYQVEVFKTIAGTLKRADEHFGDFGLRDAHRREIVKEYEIGFGEVPGQCEGTGWPFDPGTLFRMLQPYGEDIGIYDDVKFSVARKWSLTVSFGADGKYAVTSPELGIDLPKSLPKPEDAAPRPDPASKDVELAEGAGVAGVRLGESSVADVRKALGEPLESVAVGKGHVNESFRRRLTCNFDPEGKLNTVITRPGFAGRTSKGVRHGQTRADVMKLLGAPSGQRADAGVWSYDGLAITFDGFDRVSRLVLVRPKPR